MTAESKVKINYSFEKEVLTPEGLPLVAEIFWYVVVDEDQVEKAISLLEANSREVNSFADPDDGRCPHGVYVGGCGIDWMCGRCEESAEGDEDYDFAGWLRSELLNFVKEGGIYD